MLCVLHSLSHLWESDFAVGKDLRYVSVALIDFIDRQSFCINPHSQMSLHGLAVFAVLALACHELGGMSSLSSPEHSASLTRSSKRTRTGQRQVRSSDLAKLEFQGCCIQCFGYPARKDFASLESQQGEALSSCFALT